MERDLTWNDDWSTEHEKDWTRKRRLNIDFPLRQRHLLQFFDYRSYLLRKEAFRRRSIIYIVKIKRCGELSSSMWFVRLSFPLSPPLFSFSAFFRMWLNFRYGLESFSRHHETGLFRSVSLSLTLSLSQQRGTKVEPSQPTNSMSASQPYCQNAASWLVEDRTAPLFQNKKKKKRRIKMPTKKKRERKNRERERKKKKPFVTSIEGNHQLTDGLNTNIA